MNRVEQNYWSNLKLQCIDDIEVQGSRISDIVVSTSLSTVTVSHLLISGRRRETRLYSDLQQWLDDGSSYLQWEPHLCRRRGGSSVDQSKSPVHRMAGSNPIQPRIADSNKFVRGLCVTCSPTKLVNLISAYSYMKKVPITTTLCTAIWVQSIGQGGRSIMRISYIQRLVPLLHSVSQSAQCIKDPKLVKCREANAQVMVA